MTVDRRKRTSGILTHREAQVAALAAVGASNKEIALTLGVLESTIKTVKKRLRQFQRQHNIDFWGLPVTRNERNTALMKIARSITTRYRFGETDDITNKNGCGANDLGPPKHKANVANGTFAVA